MTGEDATAVAAQDAAESAALDNVAALRVIIAARAAALRAAAATATTDQATATASAASEATLAAAVEASTPVVNVAYLTQVRDQVAALHSLFAEMYTWRAQIDAGYALAVTDVADLATVIATRI